MFIAQCNEFNQSCYNVRTILHFAKVFLEIVRWGIPIALIVYGTIDLIKAMTSDDEKQPSIRIKTFGKRVIFALIIFLVPLLIRLFMSLLSDAFGSEVGNTNGWLQCWEAIDNDQSTYFNGCDDIYSTEEESSKPSGNSGNPNSGSTPSGGSSKACSRYNKLAGSNVVGTQEGSLCLFTAGLPGPYETIPAGLTKCQYHCGNVYGSDYVKAETTGTQCKCYYSPK